MTYFDAELIDPANMRPVAQIDRIMAANGDCAIRLAGALFDEAVASAHPTACIVVHHRGAF